MNRRRTTWIMVFFLALAAGYFLLTDPWSTTAREFEGLLPRDPERVTAVRITGAFDTLYFEKADGQWTMGSEVLNGEAVDNLLYGATRLTITSILPAEEVPSARNEAIEMTFYQHRRKVAACRMIHRPGGTVMGAPDGEIVYGVELKGFEGLEPAKIFSMNADHYRRHLLADLLPGEIRSVRIIPLKGEGFEVIQDGEGNLVVKLLASGNDVTGQVSEYRIRMLLSYFNGIRYGEVIGEDLMNVARLPGAPAAEIGVTVQDGESYHFQVFPWYRPGADEPDLFEALVIFNGGPGYLSVNYQYLDLLMRGLDQYR